MSTIEPDALVRLEGQAKERWIGSLFDGIAKPYDRLNRLISLGQDRAWRRKAVRLTGLTPGLQAIDLGTGTGDLALELLQAVAPNGQVIGVDIASEMLRGALAKRPAQAPYHLLRASAERTGLPAACADAVTMAWVLRNVGDRRATYAEILRILKPGAPFVCLEMSSPDGLLPRLGHRVYCSLVMPSLARLSGGDTSAYRYLARSTAAFPNRHALAEELSSAGFERITAQPLCFGSLALHRAFRPK